MKNVDRVLIIAFQNPYADDGETSILRGSLALERKAVRAHIPVTVCNYNFDANFIGTSWYMSQPNEMMSAADLSNMKKKVSQLTAASELILRGHGNAASGTVSGIGAVAMAAFLDWLGLKANCKINITSCKAARSDRYPESAFNTSGIGAQELSENSFARGLMEALFKRGLRNEVHARVQNVVINEDGSKKTRTHGAGEGMRTHKQKHSKIIFNWTNEDTVSARYAD